MTSAILELFGVSTAREDADRQAIASARYCPFLQRECVKMTKTRPPVIVGTCSVNAGTKNRRGLIICPHRLLERRHVFMDCLHLLTLHEPGNELHLVAELSVPGGSVDYVLASVRNGRVVDFVGIELQALDTTGSLWPERQRFLRSKGVDVDENTIGGTSGINWMMTAKTTLVQLLRKIETFEHVNKHLVLALQEPLLTDMQAKFAFGHIEAAKLGDAMHIHAYALKESEGRQLRLSLTTRLSTDAKGVAAALGMQISANVELAVMLAAIQAKLSAATLLTV